MIKMREWKNYYKKLFTEDQGVFMDEQRPVVGARSYEMVARISSREIKEALKGCTGGKSPGKGEYSNRINIECSG